MRQPRLHAYDALQAPISGKVRYAIHNEPYAEVTSLFAKTDLTELKVRPNRRRMDASAGVPRAPRDPFANFVPTEALRHWDRERGFVKPSSEFPLADLYICWSPEALYLGLYSFDIIEEGYYRNKSVPKIDRLLWTVQIGRGDNGSASDTEPITARVGGGREAIVNDPAVRIENLSGVQLNVRNMRHHGGVRAPFAKTAMATGRHGATALSAGDTRPSLSYRVGCVSRPSLTSTLMSYF